MPIIVRDETNTPRTVSEIIVRDGTNTPRTITEIRVRDANNVSRVVFSAGGSGLSVALDKENVSGGSFGTGTATTIAVTATASGGTAPYTYAWAEISHTSATPPGIDAPTSAATTFTQTGLGPGDNEYAEFQVEATDNVGAIATANVAAVWRDFS